jgi:type IV secretion system protein VirD4
MALTAHDLVPWLHWVSAHGPLLVGVTAGLAIGVSCLRLLGRRRRYEPEARWASWRDLRRAYLLGKTGVVLGRVGGTILRYSGRGHLLWVAATQSGKSQMLKATLLEPLPGTSVFAHDPKDELYESTGPYRATVSRVMRLAPCDEQSDCYNPLAALRLGTDHEIGDLQQFAKLLANPEGLTLRSESERHFVGLTEMALGGVTCYGMQTTPPLVTCLGDLYSVVTQGAFRDIIRDMQAEHHPLVRMAGALLGEMDEKQYANVYTTLVRVLELYADPLLAGMTSRSDFTLEEIRQGPQPLTIYLSIPFAHLARMRPFTCLLTQQLLSRATEVPNDWRQRGYWKVLGLGEEFPSLKHLQIAADIYNQGAGLGVQLCLIAPSLNAIEDIWGVKHNFLDNAHVQVFFGLTDERVAQRVSARLGTQTVTKQRVSWSRGRRTVSREQVREPLLDSSAITHMDPNDVIVIARNHQVIAQQTPWDQYRPWKQRGVAV